MQHVEFSSFDSDEEMAKQTVTLSNTLQERLLSLKPGTGTLVGWYTGSDIACVGCCTDTKLIPIGLQAVGAFCISEQNVTDKEAISLCEGVLRQQWETCPTDDSAVILYLQTSDEFLKPHICSISYSLEFGNIQASELAVVEEQEFFSQHVLLRAKGSLPLIFEDDGHEEYLQQSVDKMRVALANGRVALHLVDTSILLSHDNSQALSVKDLIREMESTVSRTPKSKTSKRRKSLIERDPIRFDILLQSTYISSEENENHTPVIKYQRNNFKSVSIPFSFDVVALQLVDGSASDAYHALTAALANQLHTFHLCLLASKNKNHYSVPQPNFFWPSSVGFPINVSYPKEFDDTQLVNSRKLLHQNLFLPLDRPLFKKLNRLELPDDLARISYLRNTHLGLPLDFEGYKTALVYGTYSYHHYMQDHTDDSGWGCAYRSMQTIVSWFRHQGYTDKPVPSHKAIQQALVDIGDKPSSFVGSKKWIGSQEVSFCLDQLIGITSKIMFVNSGTDLSNKGRELLNHFQNQGTPIMIGGGVLAHTIIGVKYNDLTGDIGYLILDPHYTGGEDLHVIQTKEWCGWKGPQFWDKTAFYNLCLPQRPTTF